MIDLDKFPEHLNGIKIEQWRKFFDLLIAIQ
jgi:hypothetical protein